ncbi:MAG: LptE family protein [Rhodothermales bacterium]|nr:LptE family protein [Rhodothermales bacterium]
MMLIVVVSGCRHYSFTGASIPEDLRTIAIPLVEDNSVNTLASLDESFTDMLVQRFVRQTRLQLEPDEGNADALLTIRIVRYTNIPTSVSGDEVATLNRVTINVSVEYRDQKNGREMLNRSFTGFDEYDPTGSDGLSGEQDAATAALVKIADDVFTAATSNW